MVKGTLEKLGLDVIIGNAVRRSLDTLAAQAECRPSVPVVDRLFAQGFTKFSTFGDLHGNTEEEWDKVQPYKGIFQAQVCAESIIIVLGCQRQRPNGDPARCLANVKRQC